MRLRKHKRTAKQGFTLVEVIIALAIAVILASIAYPSYMESVRKAKRMEGRAALMRLIQQEERFYTLHNSYIKFSFSSTDENERKFKWFSGDSAPRSAYEIKAEACANETIQNCVQLTAMPGTDNVDSNYKDLVCGDLKLNSAGVKSANKADCWP